MKIPAHIKTIKHWTHSPTEMPQALANPKKSQKHMKCVKEIVHTETSALMRKHNDMQHDDISIGLWGMKFVFM